MHLCVQPVDFGWQAADIDSLDCDKGADGHKTYHRIHAVAVTRKGALEELHSLYMQCDPPRNLQALTWIEERLKEES